jgi:hypothetical protein
MLWSRLRTASAKGGPRRPAARDHRSCLEETLSWLAERARGQPAEAGCCSLPCGAAVGPFQLVLAAGQRRVRPGVRSLRRARGSERSKPRPAAPASPPKTAGQRDSRRKQRENKEKERRATGTAAGQRRDKGGTGGPGAARKSEPPPSPRAAGGPENKQTTKQRTRRGRKPRRERAVRRLIPQFWRPGPPPEVQTLPGRFVRPKSFRSLPFFSPAFCPCTLTPLVHRGKRRRFLRQGGRGVLPGRQTSFWGPH